MAAGLGGLYQFEKGSGEAAPFGVSANSRWRRPIILREQIARSVALLSMDTRPYSR